MENVRGGFQAQGGNTLAVVCRICGFDGKLFGLIA